MKNLQYPHFVFRTFVICMLCIDLFGQEHHGNNALFEIKGNDVFSPDVDSTSLIRNHLSGWMLYDDAAGYVADADVYWNQQDSAAKAFASIFYIRWRWSELEPEEKRYAWIYNENFKKLILGARKRGLKLAFRIYVNAQDNFKQATPEFVRQAGAKGYITKGLQDFWSPYPDDPVFQRKFENFISAFGAQFNDPSIVDFVDGSGLGVWGENHGLVYGNSKNREKVFHWITSVYRKVFTKIILAHNKGSEFSSTGGVDLEEDLYKSKSYIPRIDGMGSGWFSDVPRNWLNTHYPIPFIAETCYWQYNTDDHRTWTNDPFPSYRTWTSWIQVYQQTYDDAIQYHANCLDLRTPIETQGWITRAPELVKNFLKYGGYRLYPKMISAPSVIETGKVFKIMHCWRNLGVGVCPNATIQWDHKYKPAFALIEKSTNIIRKILIDETADPSLWIKGNDYPYVYQAKVNDIPKGNYTLAIAIINRKDQNLPGINLAVKNHVMDNGWLKVKEVIIKD